MSKASQFDTQDLLEYHPLANIFPLMVGDEFKQFVANIKAEGLKEKITLFEGKILDGRNRYRACLPAQANIELGPKHFEQFQGDEAAAISFVISKNICRRHLKAADKKIIVEELLKRMPEKSDRQIADEMKVDKNVVSRVRKKAEATGAVAPVEKHIGKDGKARKRPAAKKAKKAAALSPTKPSAPPPPAPNPGSVDEETALLREFAQFVVSRWEKITFNPKDNREWKMLLPRVERTLGARS